MAVWPPAGVVETLRDTVAALQGADGANLLRWTAPEHWHVTLRFFGNAEVDLARAAFHRVAVAGDSGVVVARMGPVTGRFGRRVVHVPVAGLEGLAAATVAATAAVGERPDDRPFAGHLTLARARARDGVDLSRWCGIPVAGEWPVEELTLVASRTDGGGARYEVVDRLSAG